MRATAAILREFGKPLSVEAISVPSLAPGQILVQVDAAGVCGSDVHMWRGHDPRTPLPIILGHEGAGRVVDVDGDRLDIHGRRIRAGDPILWERGVTCGLCYSCAILREPSLCTRRWVYGIYRSLKVPPHLNGCYATHIILDARTPVLPLQAEQDPALYVAACCSGATAAHGFELSPVRTGDTVVILGPGPLGAFSVALARAGGAGQIVVIGGTAMRLALCGELGATHLIDRTRTEGEDRLQTIRDLTCGRGADLVVEASGSVPAAIEGLEYLRHGGALLLVGFGTPVGQMSLFPFESLVRKNARIQGVWVSDTRHTFQAMSLIRQHATAFAGLVTHRHALQDATQALTAVEERTAMKVVLLPQAEPCQADPLS